MFATQQEAAQSNQTSATELATSKRNQFESFDQFQEFVRRSFIKGSGIDPILFDHCIKFHSDLEIEHGNDATTPIHDILGWEYKRFGHQANEPLYAAFLMNEDKTVWQAIISLWDEDKQRPYRYLAPKGNGDRAFLPPVPESTRERIGQRYGVEVPLDGSFWKWLEEADIPRIATEGGKKGLCGLSNGYVTIALYGCSCGAKDKNEAGGIIDPYLIPDLERFALTESRWLTAFDRDYSQKAKLSVAAGKKKLTTALTINDCHCFDIKWKPEQGKGLDDLVMNSGSGAFDKAYQDAIARLEKQFKQDGNEDERTPKKGIRAADIVGREIAEQYLQRLAFNNDTGTWMRYEADYPGVWSPETNEYIEAFVAQILDGKGISGYNSHSYITNIVKKLRCLLIVRKWREVPANEVMPFTNGVLELKTGNILPHSPEYRLTWHLPREHNPLASDWGKIGDFLNHLSGGNEALKKLLICYCNAVLKGRCDLQKFLHLIGLGGTGKGTYARLIVALIGQQNVHTTTLEEWCTNRFEGSNAYRKRLVLFPDEDKQTGKLGKFLSLTGEDLIRAEEKGKKAFQYRYDGMALVLSNLPIFTGDAASRVKRRVISTPCNNPVPVLKRRNLEAEFEPELAAFTNYLLSIPDEEITRSLLGVEEIPECTLEFWQNRIRVDSIAAWLNDNVIYDPTATTAVGCDRHEGSDGSPITTLFGSYNRHCRNSGDLPKSHKSFSPDLLELCKSVLGWEVERTVTKTGKFIRGLRLRVPGVDDQYPTHDYTIMQMVTVSVGKGDGRGDGKGDGSEFSQGASFEPGDGYSYNPMENIFQQIDSLGDEFQGDVSQGDEFQGDEKQIDSLKGEKLQPSLDPKTAHDKESEPSPLPSPLPSPVPTAVVTSLESMVKTPTQHEVGQRVLLHAPGMKRHGEEGIVVFVKLRGDGKQDVSVRLTNDQLPPHQKLFQITLPDDLGWRLVELT